MAGPAVHASASPSSKELTHLWLVIGPSGCGKTTVAQCIAEEMHIPYLEGDDFHPKSNIEKMSKGTPLTDEDRWDWLTTLRKECQRRLSEPGSRGVVMTCSALKSKYRDVLRVAAYYNMSVRIHFLYLHATEELLTDRVEKRKGHYMGAEMVHSQFRTLELPQADEQDIVSVDVTRDLGEVKKLVRSQIASVLAGKQMSSI